MFFCYRAPISQIQNDNWDCSCAIVWDPVHVDYVVPQVNWTFLCSGLLTIELQGQFGEFLLVFNKYVWCGMLNKNIT